MLSVAINSIMQSVVNYAACRGAKALASLSYVKLEHFKRIPNKTKNALFCTEH